MAMPTYSAVGNGAHTPSSVYNTPLLQDGQSGFFHEIRPAPSFANPIYDNSPRLSYASTPSHSNQAALIPPGADKELSAYQSHYTPVSTGVAATKRTRRSRFLIIGAVLVGIVILVVVLVVVFAVVKPGHTKSASASSSGSSTSTSKAPGSSGTPHNAIISGGDGSTITADDGTQFTYSNKFGGFWVSDPNNPYNNNAQPNSWTPPLNQTWQFGVDRIFGVNLGGLFVLEPFIAPALFQKYPGTVDEWTLSEAMAADTANGGLGQLEDHYNTFVTEQDIAEIAGAGLNWIRLPIPFWAIETWPGEPFLAKTSWKYILRLLGWCRKYGIRVNLDLHTAPGSQNGYNHSGRLGSVNFLNGVMGYANAQRMLNYIRIITEFISQPEYQDVVPIFGIVNEALYSTIGEQNVRTFYLQAYSMIRQITGIGEGNGPYISIHDGFKGLDVWTDFLRGADRVILDTHPYFAFSGGTADPPIATGTGPGAGGMWPKLACDAWGAEINNSRSNFGVTIAGEFSNGYNDCGLYLKGIPGSSTYGGDCSFWEDASQWNASTKAGVQAFGTASMDALQDFFFWTWKIGNSTAGHVQSPLWSYKLGLEGGWLPTDPRTSVGTCAAYGSVGPQFDGTYQPWQTGGTGAGNLDPQETLNYPWPPVSMSQADAAVASLPSYTSTGTIATLPPPTMTAGSTATVTLNGWYNSQDTMLAPTAIAGCTYPDEYKSDNIAVPATC